MIRKIANGLSTVVMVLVVLLALTLVGGRLFGMQTYAVLSGSMEPAYPTGALLYVRKVDPADIQPGQVITFLLDEHILPFLRRRCFCCWYFFRICLRRTRKSAPRTQKAAERSICSAFP